MPINAFNAWLIMTNSVLPLTLPLILQAVAAPTWLQLPTTAPLNTTAQTYKLQREPSLPSAQRLQDAGHLTPSTYKTVRSNILMYRYLLLEYAPIKSILCFQILQPITITQTSLWMLMILLEAKILLLCQVHSQLRLLLPYRLYSSPSIPWEITKMCLWVQRNTFLMVQLTIS